MFGAPKPLELKLFVDKSCTKNYDSKALTAYVTGLTLPLDKLDWKILKVTKGILRVLSISNKPALLMYGTMKSSLKSSKPFHNKNLLLSIASTPSLSQLLLQA
jgi:hypothetical protein